MLQLLLINQWDPFLGWLHLLRREQAYRLRRYVIDYIVTDEERVDAVALQGRRDR